MQPRAPLGLAAPDPLLLAYFAGVIDSDGSISVRRSTYAARVRGDAQGAIYSERVTVKQVTPDVPDMLKAEFGGYRFIADPSAKRGRPLHGWEATDRRAAEVLALVRPYLRIKAAQADNALRLREAKVLSARARVAPGRGHAGGARRPDGLTATMEACYAESRNLNRVGRREEVGG